MNLGMFCVCFDFRIVNIMALLVITSLLHLRFSSLEVCFRLVYQLSEGKHLLATDFSVAEAGSTLL